MHLLVPLALLLPILVELVALGVTPLAVALAWLPLRAAHRRVVLAPRGGAYRHAARNVFDQIALPESVFTPKGERAVIERGTRRARIRLKFPRRTLLRVRIVDGTEGFHLVGAAFPAPLAGVVVGCFLGAAIAVELTGPSVFVVCGIVLVIAAFAARSVHLQASARLEELADALAAHVATAEASGRRDLRSGSPSPETSERPSPPPPEATARRSSSSD